MDPNVLDNIRGYCANASVTKELHLDQHLSLKRIEAKKPFSGVTFSISGVLFCPLFSLSREFEMIVI